MPKSIRNAIDFERAYPRRTGRISIPLFRLLAWVVALCVLGSSKTMLPRADASSPDNLAARRAKMADGLFHARNGDFRWVMALSTRPSSVEEMLAPGNSRDAYEVDPDDRRHAPATGADTMRLLKGAFYSTAARKAIYDGDEEKAERCVRKAIDIYASLPETVPALKNMALDYFVLHYLTGETAALDEAAKNMDKALALSPDDAGLLHDAASGIMEGALRNIIGDAIDLRLLKKGGEVDLLPYLCEDPSRRQHFVEAVRRDEWVAKALSHYRRALVLANHAKTYTELASIYGLTRDVPGLRDLLERLRQSPPDVSEHIRSNKVFYEGSNDFALRKMAGVEIARWEQILAAAETKGGPTLAIASTELVSRMIYGTKLGIDVDVDRMIEIAERSYEAAPSDPTNSILVGALCIRAGRTLAEQQPAYAEMVARCERSVGHAYLLASVLSHEEEELSQAVIANPDYQRVAAVMIEAQDKFPDDCGGFNWTMLRPTKPEAAAELAKLFRQNEVAQVMLEIKLRLLPARGTPALRAAFAARMGGDDSGADEILRQCAERGVPLPFQKK